MNYKAVLFDLDGTLLYTLADLKSSLNRALCHFGFPEKSLDEVRRFVGNGVDVLVELALPKGRKNALYTKVLEFFKSEYSVHCRDNVSPYDGIIPLLKKVKDSGAYICVMSNKYDSAVKDLCKAYFDGLIDFALGSQDGIRKKPYPDMAEKIIDELNVSKKEAVIVGDSEVDINTARAAGIDCISVCWGYRTKKELLECGAIRLCNSADELYLYL